VEVRAGRIAWRGVVDLLNVRSDGCEIVEFKSGEERDEHVFQLRLYSLLWARDNELNPAGRHADLLVLSYADKEVAIPPLRSVELDEFEDRLVVRGIEARRALTHTPPEAQPAVEMCRGCSVRHLCDEYWTKPVQARLVAEAAGARSSVDLRLRIIREHGPSAWQARVESEAALREDTTVILRIPPRAAELLAWIQPGLPLRILDASLRQADECLWVIDLTPRSEVFAEAP
jgi:hypothetical protein